MPRKNKAIAGYHILMILSAVDNKYSFAEDKVIADFIASNFPFHFDFSMETEVLSQLRQEEYFTHFTKSMDDFYQDSTEKERMELLEFAIRLSKATPPITKEENLYLNELYNEWTETVE